MVRIGLLAGLVARYTLTLGRTQMTDTSMEESEPLRGQVARLQEQVAALEATLEASEQRFQALLGGLQVGVIVQNEAVEIILHNQTALDLLGLTAEQITGRDSFDPRWATIHEDNSPFPGTEHPVVVALRTGKPVRDVTMGVFHAKNEEYVWLLVSAMPQLDESGHARQVVCTFTDITGRKRAEETIRAQSSLLEQMSTPIVPIVDKVIALPLVGEVDAPRAARVLEALLAGVTQHRARLALLDITGVSAGDTALATVLSQVTRGVRLLGAELVITGMSPAIARTLVELDVDLTGLAIRATLRDGVAFALARA